MATKANDQIDFNTAFALYEKISKSGNHTEITSALRLCFSVATTTQEVLKTWYADNDPGMKDVFTWREVRLRMLKLAATPGRCMAGLQKIQVGP